MKNFESTIKQTVSNLKAGTIDLSSQELFAGADTEYCFPGTWENSQRGFYHEDDVVVASTYAAELSYLVYTFKHSLMSCYGYINRFVFYPGLARAAKRYIEIHGDNIGVIDEMAAAGIEYVHDLRFWYFAYGSNMDIEQMDYRCPDAQFSGLATLDNYKLMADSVGYLTVEPCEGSSVQGVIWEISLADMRALDYYEGVSCDCYRKEQTRVSLGGEGDGLSVLIYIGNRTPLRETSPLDDYMSRVVYAAEQWELEADTLAQLKAISAA